ncbi:MAG: N(G),N(G)-dimethylarginine dimethylaminohydrolase [candidate division Zixibacteria bacterium]|nr:N(G),N(G)-dimethylarginine dimethylaminohydrolase [candidate division Zixibacteria bacterium]
MNRFTSAIVRPPGPSMVNGLTSANLGPPDYKLALRQHEAYREALRACGLKVICLDADDEHPDSTFVEDVALLTPRCAIITRPGAPSRRGETESMEPVIRELFSVVERVEAPGTVDGGDILMTGDHYFIGLSGRTNAEGARQLIQILESHGLSGSTVPLADVLHLKSVVACIDDDLLVVGEALAGRAEFSNFKCIRVECEESYVANCLWLNGTVLVADGYPKTKTAIETRGYQTIILDVSEFRKLDGGLSCLSLRF